MSRSRANGWLPRNAGPFGIIRSSGDAPRGGVRARLLRGSALLPATAAMVGASSGAFAQAVNMGGPGNSIVPDGRTATTVTVQGQVTNIRTSTFAGGNAYNSFSTFSEASGNTVNLYVPGNANNLVNIVRNGAVNIQGTLNSYKNGRIGGNVVFADSYGFVVGGKGVVNVGGLTVVTPNQATIEGMIDRNGHVNEGLAAAVIAGTVPLSADGSVVIKGQVNAARFVRITAHDVLVAGSMAEAKKVAMRRAEFESTVNTTGLAEGGAIVVRNGAISIVASNNATIGGRLSAGGTATHAGRISVAAAHNVTIAATASLTSSATLIAEGKHAALSAPGAPSITISAGDTATIAGTLTATTTAGALPGEIGITGKTISLASTAKLAAEGVGSLDGGHISVKATGTTTVAAGASFVADALGTGNGGFVEISGQTDDVSPDIKISLGAASAAAHAGTLLFDPDVLIIGATTQSPAPGDNATVSTTGSLYTNGANVELDANTSITIDGVIDTRTYAGDTVSGSQVAGLLAANNVASTGNSGSITLKAPTITIASGGALYADVYNATSGGTATTGWTAGAVSLAGQTIDIDGTVAGGPISSIATGTIDVVGSVYGGPTIFSAATKISIEASGVIDTRALDPTGTFSIADSQSLYLTAPTITTAAGSQIRAAAINTADTGFQSGAVEFYAAPFPNGSIETAGSIAAGSVSLVASSTITIDATSAIASSNAVTLDAPKVVVTTGASISATDVAYQLQQSAVIIGDPTTDSADAGAAGFVSNQTVAAYAAALGGSGTMELTALDSITLDPHAAINPATSLALALQAPTITLSGGSALGGGAVTLTAPTITIDAATTNGSRITAQSLTLATTTLDLTSTPDVIVGDVAHDGNATAAGFIGNQTIATYVTDLGGSGLLEISGTSSITLDASGLIDTRQLASGISTGNSLSVVLQAPTITLASGSAVHAEALNTNGTTFIPGVVELDAKTSLTVDGSVSGGEIDAQSPNFSVAPGVFSAASVDFELAATDATIGAAGTLSNAAVAGLVASLSGTTGFELSASDSITLASGGVINTGPKALTLTAPTLTLAAGSTLSGAAIALNAGPNGTIDIDADSTGGATISQTAGLQFNAATLDLTTTAQSLTVGSQSEPGASAPGFVTNQTVQTYVTAMGGTGTLDLTAANAIIVDATGVVDSRQITAGASTTNSLNIALNAPTVTIAAGGQILAQAVNGGGTTFGGGTVTIDASGIDVAGTIKGTDIALSASSTAITLEQTALIDARQLDPNGNATGQTFAIAFEAPSISVASGASLYGSSVGFGFTESSLLLSGSKTGQTGAGGKLSNDTVASYIAAMNGTGTFVLGVAGTLELDSSAVIEGVTSAGNVGVALAAGNYLLAKGAYVDAPVVSIDPTQSAVVIGDVSDPNATLTNQTLQVITASFQNATQEISISADSSITLDPTAIIDTRELGTGGTSTRAPLSVSLNAPSITMDKGAQILADAVNASGASNPLSGAAVTLTAEASSYKTIGAANATADISIDGTIDAGSISATAKATAESVYALNANNTSPGDISSALVGSLLTDLSPFALQPGYVQASATSSVTVGADAVLTATGNITLDSQSTGNASDPAVGVAKSGALFAAGVVVGQLDQYATTTIESGAQINASSLDVAATNNATVDVSSEQISGPTFFKGYGANNKAPAIQIDFAYGEATVDSTAEIESGATINVSGTGTSVDILARNDNAFTSSATSDALKGGKVGAAIAIGDFNSSAIAHDGASIGTTSASVGSVSVVAQSETSKDKVDASTNVGESAVSTLLAGLGVVAAVGGGAADASFTPPTFSLLGGVVAGSSKLQSAISAASTYLPQVAGSVAVSLGTQASSATISADGATAPTIHASGGVAVISDTTDSVLNTNASSGVNAEAPSASNPASYLTISAAVAVTLDTQDSSAVVGPNVTIDAGQIGIDATSSLPVPIENIDWTSPTSILNALKANTAFDTTNANAQSASGNLGIAGAVDFVSLTTNTTAWVGTGATLDTTGADGTWTSANLQSLDPNATAAIQTTFTDAQSVLATSTIETLNIPADLVGFGQTHSYGGLSVGATVALDFDTATTDAGIAAGATITSAGTVDVDAETAEHMITVTPTSGGLTSGSGTGINLSGIAAIDIVDDTTSASISNDATVTAATVDVNAHQSLGIYTFSGDVTTNGASSVGISFAYAGVTTQTNAFIGDNSNVVGTAIDPLTGTDTTLGSVSAGSIDVTAQTTGNDVVAAIAATRATGNASESPADSGNSETPPDSAPPLITAADLQPTDEETPGSSKAIFLSGIADAVSKSTTSLSISGSAGYTDTALHTAAYVDNAVIKGTGSAPSVTVTATTNTLIAVGSGSGALATSGAGSTLTAAASAAAAFESSSDPTTAYIESSNLSNVSSVSVEAQSTGLIADVGLGVSVAKPSGETPAGGLAGSASGALVADRVAAYIDNSTVTGNASAPGNLVVLADQQTTIAVGGGSFFKGGQGGGGLALTYTDITDPSAGPATDAHISNSSVTTFNNIGVVAEAPQAVYSAAAELTSSTVGVGGALVFTIDNATISASISNTGNTPLPITALDDVDVIAATDPKLLPSYVSAPAIASSVSGAQAATANYYDPSSDTSPANASDAALLTSGSAAILSIAGNVIAGGSNGIGASVVTDTIGVAHDATISGVALTAPGTLDVSALDSTSILAIGIGIGDTKTNSVQAGVVTNVITSSTTALIGPDIGTTSTAATEAYVGGATVEAIDSSVISAFALIGSVSTGSGAAVGVSIATSTIDTPATAAINHATVTTDGTFTAASDATGDIVLQGLSTADLNTFAVGVAVSKQASVAGSAVTSLEGSDVTAEILSSTVFASNDVGVLASNTNAIQAIAGAVAASSGAAGVGVSVTVNEITGSTDATITSSTVDAQALGTGSLLIVDGALNPSSTASAAAAANPDGDAAPGTLPSLGADVRSDQGLAVVAGSQQTAKAFAVSLGYSENATIVVNTVTTIMGGQTAATVTGSSIDTQATTASSGPAIDVAAYSVSYANEDAFNVAVSTSSGLAVAAAATTSTFDRTTEAEVSDTDIGTATSGGAIPAGAVTISANAYEGASTTLVGASVSGDGISATGNVLVDLFKADTEASLLGGTVYAASLGVTSNATDGYFAALGTASGGYDGAGSVSIAVATFKDMTSATVGDPSAQTATTLDLSGPLTIQATSAIDTTSYVVGFSVGGGAGLAAQIAVNDLSDTTLAALDDSDTTITSSPTNGTITINSTDDVSVTSTVGGVAGSGAVGLGASANVVVLSSANTAEMVGDTVSTPGSVSVQADEARDVSLITATAALGGSISIAATVGVILVGPEAGSDATTAVSGALSSAGTASGADLTNLGSSADGDSAAILGGSVSANGVTIDATGNLATSNIVGSLALSNGTAAAGVGASVGYTEIGETVSATAAGGTIISNSLAISAVAGDDGSGHAVNSIVFAGAGGAEVSVGGALAFSEDTDSVTAELSSTVGAGTGSVSVTASDTSTIWANAYGAAEGGAGAAGLSVATADRDSSVTAEIATLAATSTSSATTADVVADTVTVQASDAGETYGYALAGAAGGTVAGVGASTTATDNSTVLATVIGASTIVATGGLTVEATDTPDAKAFTFGVALAAGAGVGASVADAEVTANVTANVDGAVVLLDSNAVTDGLSILASTLVDGSPASSFPASTTVPFATNQFQQGQTNAVSWAIAGSGALYLAANGTVSIANDTAKVKAIGGSAASLLQLTEGNATVAATNNSDVYAQGTGVSVAGLAAVGAVVVTASASPTTTAELDATTTIYTTSTGSKFSLLSTVNVTATGTDTLNASSLAGSGGLVAGDGSSAATSDTSTVDANIGANSYILATSIDVAAAHTDDFSEMADSINAGAVGASAAISSHDASSNVGVNIGDDATLDATSAGLTAWTAGSTPALDITATNTFQDSTSGTSAGAGGGINGAGATSTVTIDNNGEGATITIGAGAILSSGFDPVNDPGSLALVASTVVNITDSDTLTTGGAIQGAGVEAEVQGQINNTVTIGAGADLTTAGELDVATYTTGNVTANAYVSTYGIAAVGDANAYIDLTDNQTIDVDTATDAKHPTILNAFGNVNVTAGDYLGQGFQTTFAGTTAAESYVQGLIAVPAADAHSSIASNATVDIATAGSGDAQTSIGAGENVTINADPGTSTLASDGTGHGYEAGFIPVTDGTDNTSGPTTSVVTIGAAVVAGEYYDQNVVINSDLSVDVTSGAAVSSASSSSFDMTTFLNTDFSGNTFSGLVATGTVDAVSLGALYASGGVIKIQAATLNGNGSLTAHGAPSITVTDDFPIYLILAGGAYIPNVPGGTVTFTGSAGLQAAQSAGMTIDSDNATGTPTITISLTYGATGGVGNSTAGPGVFNTGALTNVGGLIHIINDYGSVASAANVTADSLITFEPNGAYVFQSNDASGNYIAGGSAYSEWASAIVYPGGTPSAGTPDADDAMQYVATSIYERGNYQGQDGYYYVGSDGKADLNNPVIVTISTDGSASGTGINQALYGQAGNYSPNNTALVISGACIQAVGSASCLGSGGYNIANYDGHYGNSQQPNYVVETLSYSFATTANPNPADNESLTGSTTSQQVYGSYVAIKAATIDINGSITVGKPTTYTADVSSELGTLLDDLKQGYADIGNAYLFNKDRQAFDTLATRDGYQSFVPTLSAALYGASVDITPFVSTSAGYTSLGVSATFNPQSGQVSFGNIATFSAGANVKLDGAIVSTNTIGNIHVNSGYGNVSITNESAIPLTFGDINTGAIGGPTAGTSTVTITNRLIDQENNNSSQNDTTTFIYSPSVGISAYLSSNGNAPLDGSGNLTAGATKLTLPSGSTSTSTTYQTVIGAEFEFVQEALLSRTVNVAAYGDNYITASDWVFNSGTPNDPWYYVEPGAIGSLTATAPVSSGLTSSTPVGQVIISSNVQNGVNADPAFQETITGDTLGAGPPIQTINYSYTPLGFDLSNGQNSYNFFYPTNAFLRLTTIVKADNPFKVGFGGNAQGSLAITSNAGVTFGGTVTNPTGTTTITGPAAGPGVSGISIGQTSSGSLTSNALSITGASSVGTSATPLDVTLSPGLGTAVGSLNVQTYGSAYIALNSGANGFEVTSGGTVVVDATGSLETGTAGFGVVGNSITLTSSGGSIGSIGSTTSTLDLTPINNEDNVTANISAAGDIALNVTNGSLLVGQIASTGNGNITIDVPHGGIIAAASQTPASSLSPTQVTNIIAALNLEAGSDAAAGASSITAFQTLVASDLSTYATFLASGSVSTSGTVAIDDTSATLFTALATSQAVQAARASQSTAAYAVPTTAQIQSAVNTLDAANGVFSLTITSANLAGYQTQTAAALGITVAGFLPQAAKALGANATSAQIQTAATALYNTAVANVTPAQIQAWADAKYQAYATTFTQAYGTGWTTNVNTAIQSGTYAYTVAAGSPLATTLTKGASWTAQQLVDAIDVSALQPASANVGSSATADIIGNNVTLNVQYSVGTYDPNGIFISLQDLSSGHLNTNQQAAIAVATTPGSVLLVGTVNGQPLPSGAQIGSLPPGAVVTGVNLPQEQPLFVDAQGAFTITSGAAVYLQGTAGSSVTLNTLSAQRGVDVTAPGSILSAASAGAINITTPGDIDLIAGAGSIGTATSPITIENSTAGTAVVLTNASAGTDVNLDVVGGNADLQRVFAGGTASVTTGSGYSILSNLAGINIEAQNIVLESGEDIGASGTPLDVLATGTLTGSATGSAYIAAPTPAGAASANDLTVGNLDVGSALSLEADGTLTIAAGSLVPASNITIETGGNAILNAGTFVMAQGSGISAAGTIEIASDGDATLGALTTTVAASTGPSVAIVAGGSIGSNADGLDVSTPGTLSLSAATGIGSTATPFHIVAAPALVASVTGTTGSIVIDDDSALVAIEISAPTSVSLTAASMNLPTISSGTITLDSAGEIDFAGQSLTATVGGVQITGGTIVGLSVTSNDGAVSLTSTGPDVVSGTTTRLSIDVATVSAATTFEATAQAGGILLGPATSGGTQTIVADAGDVLLTQLISTGGDIDVTSQTGSIRGGTVSADGSASLTSATANTGASVVATNGGVTLTAGSLTTPSTAALIDWTTAQAGTTLDATSGGALTLTNATSGTTGANGAQTIHANGAIDLTNVVATAGTFGVTSDASTVTIDNATSGGTQTIGAAQAVTFRTLTATLGDIDVTGASVDGTSTTVPALTTDTGAIMLISTGPDVVSGGTTRPSIDVTTLSAATTFGATAQAGGILLGTATSGGTQTIVADAGDVAFTTLTTSQANAGSPLGDIDVTSQTAAVQGGSVSADGSASLTSATANTGASVVATNGSVTLTAGSLTAPSPLASIDWTTAQAGTTLDATSGGALTLANATSGTTGANGAQTIHANGAIDLTNVIATAGTLGVTSNASTVTIDNATSGGTQTIEAAQRVTFRTLTATLGDIDATGASISGTSATVPALTTDTGAVMLISTGPDVVSGGTTRPSIDVTTISAATTFGATAQAGGILLGTATSGGTQTVIAEAGNVVFTQLTAQATKTAPLGDIDVTSQTGAVQGGSVSADGSASLTSVTANTGASVVATNGSVTLTAGSLTTPSTAAQIDWTTAHAGTTLDATSGGALTLTNATSGTTGANGAQTIYANGAINLTTVLATAGTLGVTSDASTVTIGSATSDETQTIVADTAVMFTQLTTNAKLGGNIDVTSRTTEVQGGSVSADGSASLTSVSANTGASVVATNGSVTLTAGSLTTPNVAALIDWTTAQAGTTLDATSGGALTLTNATSGTTGANGAQTIHANGAINLTNVIATAGTLGVASDASTVTIGSATSDQTQTIVADTAVMFTQLTTTENLGGDIDVTSQTGAVQGGSVSADGSASLTSVTANTGTSVVATNGSVTLTAGSLTTPNTSALIDWTTAQAGTTLDATSGGALTLTNATSGTTGANGAQTIHANGTIGLTNVVATAGTLGVTSDASSVTIDNATSGGTQTIEAAQAVTFRTLTATLGDIDVTGASIDGTSTSATVPALTTDTGAILLIALGPDVVSGGTTRPSIDVTTISAATTLGAKAKDGGILLGTATSGGTQTIVADAGDVAFTTLTSTGGDIDVTSQTDAVQGGSVSADGSASLTSVTANTGVSVVATNGSVTLTAGSLTTPNAAALIDWTTAQAGTTLNATSGGALTLTTATSGTMGANGAQTIHASGAINLTNVVATAGTLGVTSDASSVTIDNATSGGTQTIEAAQAVTFRTLTATLGDIDVTGASISGTSTSATVPALTTDTGAILLIALGPDVVSGGTTRPSIDVTTISAATTFGATAQAGGILLGTATSGGTQTIEALKTVAFQTLTSTGGDIDVTSSAGSILGTTLTAYGSADLAAYDDNIGTTLTAQTGSASLRATTGEIDWQTLSAATTIEATASAGEIVFGTAKSGGSQTLTAATDIVFGQLTTTGLPSDRGDITLTAQTGYVHGGSIDAAGFVTISGVGIDFDDINARVGLDLESAADIQGNDVTTLGSATLNAQGDVGLGSITAAEVALSTPTSITITSMTISTEADFAAANVTVGDLRQAPGNPGPFLMDLTGYRGGVGSSATLFIDTPNGLVVPVLSEDVVKIGTSARQVTIEDAFLTGTMRLTTPDTNLWFNDVSSQPVLGNNVQFFRPDDRFFFTQDGTITTTNSYVVQYDASAIIRENVDGVIYYGPSFVRDIDRAGRIGDSGLVTNFGADDGPTLWDFPIEAFDQHLARIRDQVVAPIDPSHAVNLEGGDGFKIVFKRKKPQKQADAR